MLTCSVSGGESLCLSVGQSVSVSVHAVKGARKEGANTIHHFYQQAPTPVVCTVTTFGCTDPQQNVHIAFEPVRSLWNAKSYCIDQASFRWLPSWRLMSRGLRCYPLRVAFLQISGLLESLDCPSDWFVGVAEKGECSKTSRMSQTRHLHSPQIRRNATLSG